MHISVMFAPKKFHPVALCYS